MISVKNCFAKYFRDPLKDCDDCKFKEQVDQTRYFILLITVLITGLNVTFLLLEDSSLFTSAYICLNSLSCALALYMVYVDLDDERLAPPMENLYGSDDGGDHDSWIADYADKIFRNTIQGPYYSV